MTDDSISLYFSLKPGEKADLEVIATRRWNGLNRHEPQRGRLSQVLKSALNWWMLTKVVCG